MPQNKNDNDNFKNIINELVYNIFDTVHNSEILNKLPPIEAIEKNNELCDIVRQLSKKPLSKDSDFNSINDKLKAIYFSNNFRHLYSEIEKVVLEITKNSDNTKLELNSQTLKDNITYFYRFILKNKDSSEGNEEEIQYIFNINKLYDHISLGLNRALYTMDIINAYETDNQNKISELNGMSSQLKDDIETTKKDIGIIKTETVNEIEKSKNETISHYVSILGIFAGIIMAFFGGINLFVGMFSNYEPRYLFSYTFFSIVMGIILFDTIAALMYVVAHISGKSDIFSKGKGIRKLFKFLNIISMALAVLMFFIAYCQQDFFPNDTSPENDMRNNAGFSQVEAMNKN